MTRQIPSLIDIATAQGRYRVYTIDSERCDSYDPEQLWLATDDLQAALNCAGLIPRVWGGCVVDTTTGEADYGAGFGEPLPPIED